MKKDRRSEKEIENIERARHDEALLAEEEVNIEEVMAEYDRESNTRHFTSWRGVAIKAMLIAFSLFVLWMNVFSTLPEQIRRALFVGIVIFMGFMLYPARKGKPKLDYVPWYDFVLGILGFSAFFYWVVNFEGLASRSGNYNTVDIIAGIIGILVLFELCRRVVGIPILIVAGVFIVYAFVGGYLPGMFGHRGFGVTRVVEHLFYTLEGVIGTPIGVCSTFIVLFILFGAFLEKTGVGKFFIDIANAIAGHAPGGPAKVAIIASALEGTVSGSSVANTVGSGSFTIPMMKKTGYKPEFAAAVEAAASTGGQIMPPIMGAAAFLMAEMTGNPYATIAVAAILPALLYFTGIWLMVHFEAKKLGLKGIDKSELPRFWPLLLKKGYLLLPLIFLIVFMGNGFTPSRSAVFAILIAIVVSLFRKETRISPKGILEALENGAKSTIGVAAACSIAGIIVGIVTLTGLGLKLATGLLALSGGITIIALFFTMIASIILGMGVPTTANYVIMATITAPIVIRLGVPTLAAHMFVFYFGIVADITPPVALAAYAGSAIAHSNPFKTGVTATRLAITAFLIPYIFALNPSLLLIDTTPGQVVLIVVTALVGMIGISSGMEGYLLHKMPVWQRVLAVLAGLLLIIPGLVTDAIGIGVIGLIALWQLATRKKVETLPS